MPRRGAGTTGAMATRTTTVRIGRSGRTITPTTLIRPTIMDPITGRITTGRSGFTPGMAGAGGAAVGWGTAGKAVYRQTRAAPTIAETPAPWRVLRAPTPPTLRRVQGGPT